MGQDTSIVTKDEPLSVVGSIDGRRQRRHLAVPVFQHNGFRSVYSFFILYA